MPASKGSDLRKGFISLSLNLKALPPVLSALQARHQFFSSQTKDKRLEAIEKSQQLHAELKEVRYSHPHVVLSHIFANQPSLPLTQMIAAQKARQSEKLRRPFGSNFLSFLKASKPENDNIFFSLHLCSCYWPIKFMPCVQGYENYKQMRARRMKKLSGCVVA